MSDVDSWLEAAYEDRTYVDNDGEPEFLTLTPQEEDQLEELMQEFDDAANDTIGDHGIEAWEGGGYFEVGKALSERYPPRVRHEFRRTQGLL